MYYIRHLPAVTTQHIHKISILVAKGYNSSINHVPIIKSSNSYTKVQNYAETLGLYFVAALSNRALFSSKSARNWWSGLTLWSFLQGVSIKSLHIRGELTV
jgi:mannose/fructose/N-acetylgalactosamine-specific phosphotransferase system component IID